MRWHRWISILAVLGVLVHAGALVRHNGVMAGATFQYQALLTGLAQLCHTGTASQTLPPGDLPYVPKPTDAQNGCPVCSGLSSAVALVAPELPSILLPASVTVTFHGDVQLVACWGHAVCPPARGPPAAA
jgi:hypothetical protein